MDEIRNYYGSTEVETEGRKRLATAQQAILKGVGRQLAPYHYKE